MNYKDELIEILTRYKEKDIVITIHAQARAIFRNIDLDEVKRNLLSPEKLSFAGKEGNNKYSCYFGYSKTLCHKS